jgi:hypothetical protein
VGCAMSHQRFLLILGVLIVVLVSLVMADKDRPCLNEDGTPCLADGRVRHGGGSGVGGVGGGGVHVPRVR